MNAPKLNLVCVRFVAVHERPQELMNDGAYQVKVHPIIEALGFFKRSRPNHVLAHSRPTPLTKEAEIPRVASY